MHKYTQIRGQDVLPPDLQKLVDAAKSRPDRAERVAADRDLLTAPRKPSRRKKAPEPTAEHLLDTLDVTPPLFDPLEKLKKLRSRCQETGFLLQQRGYVGNPLYKAGGKILNCSIWGLFQSISPAVNYKVGTALCKNRLCPNCQRVLAAKRRANFLDWFELNKAALRPYFFYHMVLTVRHSVADGVRTNLYTPDLLRYFAELRGTSDTLTGAQRRQRSASWKAFVAGGSYSVEVKAGKDTSPHIHIHVLLVAKKQLWNLAQDSKFLLHVKPLWQEITGDSQNVFVEPVYYEDPETKMRHNCHKGSSAFVDRAVAECMKYTIKAGADDLAGYSDAFLHDLLTFRNRYYSRFGCLSSNDQDSRKFQGLPMLCTDYKDLEQMERTELARLLNPETGELVNIEATKYTARPFRYVRGKPGASLPEQYTDQVAQQLPVAPNGRRINQGGEPYYELLPMPVTVPSVWLPQHAKQQAAVALSRSVRGEYEPAFEIATPHPKP